MLLHRSDLNIISQKTSPKRLAFSTLELLKRSIFLNFVVILADFHEIRSDFLRFSRKCGKTLQQLLLEISRFQFNFIMIILEIHLIFDFFSHRCPARASAGPSSDRSWAKGSGARGEPARSVRARRVPVGTRDSFFRFSFFAGLGIRAPPFNTCSP